MYTIQTRICFCICGILPPSLMEILHMTFSYMSRISLTWVLGQLARCLFGNVRSIPLTLSLSLSVSDIYTWVFVFFKPLLEEAPYLILKPWVVAVSVVCFLRRAFKEISKKLSVDSGICQTSILYSDMYSTQHLFGFA